MVAELKEKTEYYHRLYVNMEKPEMMDLYDFPIHFYEHGLCGKSFVDAEWERYFSRWSQRSAPVESVALDEGSASSGIVKISLKYRYNWTDLWGQTVRGTARCHVTWKKTNSGWRIKRVDETR